MNSEKPTIIVAGVTRCGTSLTMQMIHAGGHPVEGEFPAYEEHLLGETPWEQMPGKAVKLIDAHLHFPPPGGNYRVVLCVRDAAQQAKSVFKFTRLVHGVTWGLGKRDLKLLALGIMQDTRLIREWAASLGEGKHLFMPFEETITAPLRAAERLAEFIGGEMDVKAMAACVRPRHPDCLKNLLELELLESCAPS